MIAEKEEEEEEEEQEKDYIETALPGLRFARAVAVFAEAVIHIGHREDVRHGEAAQFRRERPQGDRRLPPPERALRWGTDRGDIGVDR